MPLQLKAWSLLGRGTKHASRDHIRLEGMPINIEWQDQFGRWHHYQSKQNQADTYRLAQRRAKSIKKVPPPRASRLLFSGQSLRRGLG